MVAKTTSLTCPPQWLSLTDFHRRLCRDDRIALIKARHSSCSKSMSRTSNSVQFGSFCAVSRDSNIFSESIELPSTTTRFSPSDDDGSGDVPEPFHICMAHFLQCSMYLVSATLCALESMVLDYEKAVLFIIFINFLILRRSVRRPLRVNESHMYRSITTVNGHRKNDR